MSIFKFLENRKKEKSKGFGDTISKITHALHIKECEGCAWRRKKLNEWFPYESDDDENNLND